MIIDSSFLRKNRMPDVLYLKHLYEVTTDAEIKAMIVLLDKEHLTSQERQEAELFFLKVRQRFDTWYDAMLGLVENFDFDLLTILNNTFILDKLKAERNNDHVDMGELF